ncbi:MAG: RsmE family RNA methyltransferase [Ginsengibacter sp.]
MQLPFFFEEEIPLSERFLLSEESSRHIVQVLRMNEGENLLITNGKGELLTASLINAHKKNALVEIISRTVVSKQDFKATIGISLIKNRTRFEWFLEKATEIGVSEIIPFISNRTEKQHFREDRMKGILISAMLQSQQAWLPELHSPVKFKDIIDDLPYEHKYIAHCVDEQKESLSKEILKQGDALILIGPEGDFTKEEIEAAIENNFKPVSLGETRLRTETAALVAAVLLLNK